MQCLKYILSLLFSWPVRVLFKLHFNCVWRQACCIVSITFWWRGMKSNVSCVAQHRRDGASSWMMFWQRSSKVIWKNCFSGQLVTLNTLAYSSQDPWEACCGPDVFGSKSDTFLVRVGFCWMLHLVFQLLHVGVWWVMFSGPCGSIVADGFVYSKSFLKCFWKH